MCENFLVANKIPVDLNKKNSEMTASEKVIVELYGVLLEFFRICFERGVLKGVDARTDIVSMLKNALLYEGVLRISFPKKVRKRFNLEICYSVPLVSGAPTFFYTNELLERISCFSFTVNTGVGIRESETDLVESLLKKKKATGVVVNLSRTFGVYNIRIKYPDGRNDNVFSYKDFDILLRDIKRFI